jgi:hypothetical protein
MRSIETKTPYAPEGPLCPSSGHATVMMSCPRWPDCYRVSSSLDHRPSNSNEERGAIVTGQQREGNRVFCRLVDRYLIGRDLSSHISRGDKSYLSTQFICFPWDQMSFQKEKNLFDCQNRPGPVYTGHVRHWGLVHFPISTQNIFFSTHHIKSFDACMEH